MALELRNIVKRFGGQTAVDSVSINIESGEFFALLGPSGCGKSTLLRMLSGIETPDSGQIILDGLDLTRVPSQKRPFNMVFQSYALFPNLTVRGNLEFGLKIKGLSGSELNQRVDEALEMIGLRSFADRMPETLSGGQQQRVAVARAIVNRPKVLLLDEPLSALDKNMREHMQKELRILQKQLGITFIFVTHDQEEAMALADRVAVMAQGRFEQVATPWELYNVPANLTVATFLGNMNDWSGEVINITQENFEVRLENCESGVLIQRSKFRGSGEIEKGQHVRVCVRPEKFELVGEEYDPENKFEGVVQSSVFKGLYYDVTVKTDSGILLNTAVEADNQKQAALMRLGQKVQVGFYSDGALAYSLNSGAHPK